MRFAAILFAVSLLAETAKVAEPRLSSIYPLTGQREHTYEAVIRGTNLTAAQALFFRDPDIHARVLRVEDEQDRNQLLHIEVAIGSKAATGPQKVRVVTAAGTSNEIVLRVADRAVIVEPADHTIQALPATVTGKISESGETDDYWFEVSAGQSVTFFATSGIDSFDPSITLYEASGSWFAAKRLNRLSFNDEQLIFPGLSKDAQISHRFAKAGKYCVRIQGQAGQGGPDSVYELHLAKGIEPPHELRPVFRADWEEHELTRAMGDDWMRRVAARGTSATVPPQAETYRAVVEGTEIPTMKIPGIVEGVIAKPGELHTIKIAVDKAQELAIEIETPKATMPLFNPIVRLLEPGGTEIIANVYTRLNNNNFQMMKALKAKATFSLVAPGTYTLQIRELATDHAGDDFQYRVLIRQQIPHVGKFVVQQERMNLERGNTRPVSVRIEREEGFDGIVAVQVENLPQGVVALPGVENPAERPALPNAGKPERYQPRTQTTSVLLAAASDAPVLQMPTPIRVTARPVRDGRLGEPIASAEVLLMVVNPQ